MRTKADPMNPQPPVTRRFSGLRTFIYGRPERDRGPRRTSRPHRAVKRSDFRPATGSPHRDRPSGSRTPSSGRSGKRPCRGRPRSRSGRKSRAQTRWECTAADGSAHRGVPIPSVRTWPNPAGCRRPRRRSPRSPPGSTWPGPDSSGSADHEAFPGETANDCLAQIAHRFRRRDSDLRGRSRRTIRGRLRRCAASPVSDPEATAPRRSSRALFALARDVEQVLSIMALLQLPPESGEVFARDVAHPERDLLDAGDLDALPMLQYLHEVRRVEEAIVRAGIEPRHAAAEIDEAGASRSQIRVVEIGDLQFAARGRTKLLREGGDLVVVEIEAGHGEIALRLLRLLLDREQAAALANLGHPVALWVVDPVTEQRASVERLGFPLEQRSEAVTVEDVVAQHESDAFVADECLADEERLGKPIRSGLLGV